MRFGHRWFLTLLLVTRWSNAQLATAGNRAAGSVSGHIYCVDTNLPARLTEITLQTIDVKPDPAPGEQNEPGPALRTYQTALDGSYTIPNVRPGSYYVILRKAGYLSPITQFTRAELSRPSPEIMARIVKAVPTATVEAGHTTTLDVRLERGAAFAGTIHYDDGSPVASASVAVLNKETKAGKETWVSSYPRVLTDDQGHYRITSLAAGEYLLRVALEIDEKYVSTVLGGSMSSSSNTKFALTFYAGDTARQSDGKPVKLAAGEERDGADILVPVSKLHSVSGTIAEARTGHTVNSGKLTLSYEDGAQLATAAVDKEDGMFHFDFVPEGSYILAVSEAKDVTRQEVMRPAGYFPPSETKETAIREYGPGSQPLRIESDITGLTMSVPAKGTKVYSSP